MVAVWAVVTDDKGAILWLGPFPSPWFCSISISKPPPAEIPFVSQWSQARWKERGSKLERMGRTEMSMDECKRRFYYGKHYLFIFLKRFLLIDWLITILGLRFYARVFSSCGKRGPLFIAVRGPLTVTASPVAEHRLQTRRLSSCGSRAQPLRGMWDPPRPGLEPVSPALAGRFSTTAPPGKPGKHYLSCKW